MLQYASNRGTPSTSVTNSAFLFTTVAMPINSRYSYAYYVCRLYAFCSCAQLILNLLTYIVLVKIVEMF
jgi:hypothetical protein